MTMRSFLASIPLVLVLLPGAAADDHQTAAAEAAIGADLEILTRHANLAVVAGPAPELVTVVDPEVAEPGSMRTAVVDALVLDVAQSMYARTHATAVASNAAARVYLRSAPVFDLINSGDDPLPVQIRVRVPGAFPTPGGPPYEPSAYLINGSTDDNYVEVARARQHVSVVSSPYIEGGGVSILEVNRETRDALGTDIPPGPGRFDQFGVFFQRDYTATVPPSFVQVDESTIEIRLYPIGLWVIAEATAVSILEGTTSEPITFDMPELCAVAAPPDVVRNPLAGFDPLCRAGRAGESPACRCLRDDTLRSQRCSFTFPEFFATVRLPSPAVAGERVDAEWTILPGAPAEFWMKSEIFANGKWIPIDDKGRTSGHLTEEKTTSLRTAWTMPGTPTLLRTRFFHLPKGAKQPVESQMTTMVALRKEKK
jgi:hypothetical protein